MKLTTRIRVRIEKDIIVKIPRFLKGEGKIFVTAGREVSPEDIIGSAIQFKGFRTVNLATLLSVKPSQVTKYIKRAVGQKIYKGELLAFKKGNFFSSDKIITSPTDGEVDFINSLTGEVRISLLPKKIDLAAGVYGVVEKVDEKTGSCLIRAQITRLYGTFGIGKIREGTLMILTKRDGVISKEMILPKFDEYVLIGGNLSSKEVLNSAISAGVNGMIIGGINASDYKAITGGRISFQHKFDEDMGLSLLVCEGFGPIGIGEDIFEIIKEYDGKFLLVDGNNATISLPSYQSSSMIKVRNTKLPETEESLVPGIETLAEVSLGAKVRVVGASFTGEQGKIVALDKTDSLLPSQIRSIIVTVETSRRRIQTSYKNIEIIQ